MSLELILAEIRQWEAGQPQNGARDEAVRYLVAGTIAPFLGQQATQRVLQPVANDNSRLLSSVEDVLATFLGGKAASHLVNRAMDRVIVRI